MTQQYVTFLFPGSLFPNERNLKINNKEAKFEIPNDCFAYYFRERQEVESNGETLYGDWQNKSGRTYFGEVYDVQQIAALFPDKDILLSNMRCNNWNRVVRTRRGNFQPIEENDVVIESANPQ